jgi:hypothetical protein
LSNLHRIAIEFRNDISSVLSDGGAIMMSARIRRPIGSVAFVSALLVSTFAAGPRAGTAEAADCLIAPTSSAPPNSHWYYRTDRATQRKCWYLRAINDPPQQGTLKTAQAGPAANDHSFASFKESWPSAERPSCPTRTSKDCTRSSWNGAATPTAGSRSANSFHAIAAVYSLAVAARRQ